MRYLLNTLVTLTIVLIGFALAQPARATVITIDFEALADGDNASAYLAGFGISISAIDAGTALFAADETIVYGGGVVDAPSGTMYLVQIGDGSGGDGFLPPNTFTLDFSTALDSFGFSESAILVPSILSPWTATAYDGLGGTGTILDTASFSGFPTVHPTLTFTLAGPAIASVTFNQTAQSNAAFFQANLDDFVLITPVPEPSSLTLFGFGLAGLGFLMRRRRNRR